VPVYINIQDIFFFTKNSTKNKKQNIKTCLQELAYIVEEAFVEVQQQSMATKTNQSKP